MYIYYATTILACRLRPLWFACETPVIYFTERTYVFTVIILELSYIPKSRVCYEKYGCFNSHPNRRLVKLPQSPSRIGTRFNLFTRNNRNSARLIDDRNKYKLTASHFKISRRTILVIHGFRGKGKRGWGGGCWMEGYEDCRDRWISSIYSSLLQQRSASIWLFPLQPTPARRYIWHPEGGRQRSRRSYSLQGLKIRSTVHAQVDMPHG